MNIILEAKSIYKSYKNNSNNILTVLKDVSLTINKNEITVIVGASGSGKSTLLHILSGLDEPDSGEVLFLGNNIHKLNNEQLSIFRNKNIGFVFQFHHLLPEFTAIENVAIPYMVDGKSLKSALLKAEEIMTLVGLSERLHHKPAELSGGEQQRVAIARALINNPSIIFADEPTGNLDSVNGESIHQLFLKLKNEMNMTFVIVTHNSDLIKLADTIFEIKDGIVQKKI
ncbi:MAG: ABC transporter ATP-binding protein [Ignavibacterium sp.]|nr:ABC transporter ATP-binding protein [Ignavibacterium sp.]MCX7612581.1 ABC transporter ATP-binding protein [Ignavibacterium sp.]MDW8375004.1 ABC transporter ATP-binding protein [Ignavibacteriales bacterium]